MMPATGGGETINGRTRTSATPTPNPILHPPAAPTSGEASSRRGPRPRPCQKHTRRPAPPRRPRPASRRSLPRSPSTAATGPFGRRSCRYRQTHSSSFPPHRPSRRRARFDLPSPLFSDRLPSRPPPPPRTPPALPRGAGAGTCRSGARTSRTGPSTPRPLPLLPPRHRRRRRSRKRSYSRQRHRRRRPRRCQSLPSWEYHFLRALWRRRHGDRGWHRRRRHLRRERARRGESCCCPCHRHRRRPAAREGGFLPRRRRRRHRCC